MKEKTLNKMYESIGLIKFEDDPPVFSKTSEANRANNLLIDFLNKFVKNGSDYGSKVELTDMEQGVVDTLQVSTSPLIDNLIKVDSLDLLKSYIKRARKYIGDNATYNWLDVSSLTSLAGLFGRHEFSNNTTFNGDISHWNISNVVNMDYTFLGCESFNRDLSGWDFSNVKYMSGCFVGCNSEFRTKMKSLIDLTNVKTKFHIF